MSNTKAIIYLYSIEGRG